VRERLPFSGFYPFMATGEEKKTIFEGGPDRYATGRRPRTLGPNYHDPRR